MVRTICTKITGWEPFNSENIVVGTEAHMARQRSSTTNASSID
jgi:hypothetical protein